MTITLSWWALPIAIVVGAILFGALADRRETYNGYGGMSGCACILIITTGVLIAIGIIAGHYL